MRYLIPAFFLLALGLGATEAQARSCSSFVVIKGYKPEAGKILVEHERGNLKKFFPKPEGAPSDTTKIPSQCRRSAQQNVLDVTASGGRMSITQIRTNFEGKMLNDADSAEWFEAEIQKLVDGGTEVVAVLRPGRKREDPVEMTTIYLPAGPEDFAEIERLEAQAEDL